MTAIWTFLSATAAKPPSCCATTAATPITVGDCPHRNEIQPRRRGNAREGNCGRFGAARSEERRDELPVGPGPAPAPRPGAERASGLRRNRLAQRRSLQAGETEKRP